MLNVKMKYTSVESEPFELKLAKEGDSGFDLKVVNAIYLPPFSPQLIDHMIAIKLPEGHEAQLRPRSSALFKKNVHVSFGTIDEGYTGVLKTCAMSIHPEGTWLEAGESVSQLVIVPCVSAQVQFEIVEELEKTERGDGGFGSSGI